VYEDTVGRTAAESLRDIAPAVVRDRVRLSISLAPTTRPPRRWPLRAAASAALVVILAIALSTGLAFRSSHRPTDSLALIVDKIRAADTGDTGDTGGTSVEVAGRKLRIEEYDVDGGRVLVAYDTQPFPMPDGAHVATALINGPWSAPVDGWYVRCFNEPRPALLIGDKDVRVASVDALAHRLSLS
jgi:hypothetical protein